MPESWREPLLKLSLEHLVSLPTTLPVDETWPASLREFVRSARELALEAQPANEVSHALHGSVKVEKAMKKGMGNKKAHEVDALAALMADTAQKCGAGAVVDFGAGQGYLSQVPVIRQLAVLPLTPT